MIRFVFAREEVGGSEDFAIASSVQSCQGVCVYFAVVNDFFSQFGSVGEGWNGRSKVRDGGGSSRSEVVGRSTAGIDAFYG